jgi:hypothetical protein
MPATLSFHLPETKLMRTLRRGLSDKAKDKFRDDIASGNVSVNETGRAYILNALSRNRSLSDAQKAYVRDAVLDDLFGFGPLGPLLRNPQVANIYLEGLHSAYVEKYGTRGAVKRHKVRVPFDNEEHLLDIINRIMVPMGSELSHRTPMVSVTLPNGSRAFAAMAPATVHGPTLSIICKEHSVKEVLPNWFASFSHFESVNEATSVKITLPDGSQTNGFKVQLDENRSTCYLSQSLNARPFRGKKILFSGVLQFHDEDELARRGSLDTASGERTAKVVIKAHGSNEKTLVASDHQIGFDANEPVSFTGELDVPVQAVKVRLGVYYRGPIKATLYQLSFKCEPAAKTYRSQGPKNFELRSNGASNAC